MKNDYEIRGDVTAIIINSPKYGRHEAMISTSKLERVKEFPNSWYVVWNPGTQSFYAFGKMPRANGKQTTAPLHRWITNAPDEMVVDHRNHDTLNNTDKNLRVVTHAENMQNRKCENANSTSGVRGVCWHKKNSKWIAKVKVLGKEHHVGCFEDKTEAEIAIKDARMNLMMFSDI